MDNNPLFEIQFHIPFGGIRAEHVEPAIRRHIATAEERLEAIASGDGGPRTFANTLAALDSLSDELDYALAVVRHLEIVATTPELRAAYNKVEPLASAFYSRVPLHAALWNALKEFAETEEAKSLTGVRRRFLEKTLRSFRRHGADLPPQDKQRLEKLDVELAAATTKFAENVLDSTNAFELIVTDERQLSGLPPIALDAARESAQSKGREGWRFTLQQPSYLAVMTYLDDAGIRETMYRAYHRRASAGDHDNRDLVARILSLRHEKADLLGYADFAEFALEDRMAKSGERAQAFLDELLARSEDCFHRENQELSAFRRELDGSGAPALQPWDIPYYAEKLRKARFDFDEEELRPYFPLEGVIAGLFGLAHRLFGILIEQETGVPVWDPQVRYYRILDGDGAFLGAFYADWYPRENKRGGAWMDAFLLGRPRDGTYEPHLGVICGNLTPPAGGRPALLTHHDVETVFHEFGHLLHHCLSRVEVHSFGGTNVAWDFVELPSQIMENWCWERESLDLFARHWESGDPLPEEHFRRLLSTRTYRAANDMMRQLGFGFVDLYLHRRWSPDQDGDAVSCARRILERFSPAPLPEGHAMINAFTHLFANPVGYGAGYYSYKWAEVLEADAFLCFRRQGIYSLEVGMRFRREILSRGDSDEPGALFRAFVGRDPDPQALLERAGLAR